MRPDLVQSSKVLRISEHPNFMPQLNGATPNLSSLDSCKNLPSDPRVKALTFLKLNTTQLSTSMQSFLILPLYPPYERPTEPYRTISMNLITISPYSFGSSRHQTPRASSGYKRRKPTLQSSSRKLKASVKEQSKPRKLLQR